ncbi:MAG: GNAT family N-acetyltransferase [Armatimonadota bacterium]
MAATEPQQKPVQLTVFNWRKHGHDVLGFQREIYETNFDDCTVDRDFLRDYAANLRDACRWDSEHLVVLERGSETVGFMWLSIMSTLVEPRMGYVKNIYVVPELRGKDHARQMLDYADQWFINRGCEKAALDATCSNQRAVGLYDKCGYEVVRYRMEKTYD